MAKFYGLRIRAGIMTVDKVPRLWKAKTEMWLEQNPEQ